MGRVGKTTEEARVLSGHRTWLAIPFSLLCGACEGLVLDPVSEDAAVQQRPVFDGGLRPDASFPDATGTATTADAGMVAARDSAVAVVDAGMPSDSCGVEDTRYAKDVQIAEISLYQVVKVPLFSNGAWVTARTSPIVQGKKSLVRVFVKPASSFASRTLRAVLTLTTAGTPKRFTSDLRVAQASTDASLTSSFNFTLEASDVAADTAFSVAVVEAACTPPEARGPASAARLPVDGVQALNAEWIKRLQIQVVPTTINGNTATPTAAQIEKMRAAMLAFYPVPGVDISVHAPLDINSAWNCTGCDQWGSALNAVVALRTREAPARDVYYYGLLNPKATFALYCSRGCVLGVAYANSRIAPNYQVGIGVGYDNNGYAYETMVHELGHAHGRSHAPCSTGNSLDPSSVDADYPDPAAATESWGWDSRSNVLLPPTNKDVMSYCEPVWISDYTYAAIADRSAAVNTQARVLTLDSELATGPRYRNLILGAPGKVSWGTLVEQGIPPGEPLWADVLDGAGSVVDRVLVYLMTLSNETSAFVFVPDLVAGARTLTMTGRTIQLPQ